MIPRVSNRTPNRTLSRARLCLLLAVALLAAPARSLAQSCLAGTAADEFTADRAGLTREWILQLPSMANGTSLAQVVVGDGLVVAQTSDGAVHAVQSSPFGDAVPPAGSPRPGSLLWSEQVGRSGGPIVRAGIGPDLVAVPHDRGLAGLERSNGQPRWHESFGQSVSAGAAVIGNWVYVPSSAGTVRRFAVQPLRHPEPTPAAAANSSNTKTGKKPVNPATSPSPSKTARHRKESLDPVAINDGGSNAIEFAPRPLAAGVLWCTSDGVLVSLQPTELEWRRLEFSLENPPAGPPAVRDRSIFASTRTGDLARIDLPAGMKELQLVWHTVLPGPAYSGPFVSGDTVVVSLGDLGIAAYSAETGAELWQTCLTGQILAIGGGRVWLIDELGKLSAFDLADGSPRERLCLGPFTMPIVNTFSDRLLLASPSGMLVSLAPRGSRGTPTPAEGAATGPAAPAPAPSDPAARPRP
jgi:outer membrane protein assembly factor BamB